MSIRKRRVRQPEPIPSFRSEDEEHDFWATADATDYFDFSKARRVSFPNLKRSTKGGVSSRRTERLRPVSPGELLLHDFLEPMSLSAQQLASKIKVNPRGIRDVVANRRTISADLDLRLCRFFGLSSGYWLRAQAVFDLAIAQRSLAKPKNALNNTRITVRFDGKLLRNLDRLRRELGQSRSEIARDAIRLHLAGLAVFRAQVFRGLDQLAAARGLETALHRDVRLADKQIAAGKSVSHASVARKLRARLIGKRRLGASS